MPLGRELRAAWSAGCDELARALAPRACPLCGAALVATRQGAEARDCPAHRLPRALPPPACPRCARTLPESLRASERCAECRREPPPFEAALALGAWRAEPGLRAFVLAWKHGRRAELARPLGRLLAARLRAAGEPSADALLVPVPLTRWRRLERGHDQALGLARAVGEELGLAVMPALARRRHGPPQGSLLGRSRAANVRDAFRLRAFAARRIGGRALWLVDDVATSGATAAECARVLRRGGARSVSLLVLARAGQGGAGPED